MMNRWYAYTYIYISSKYKYMFYTCLYFLVNLNVNQ